MRWCKEAPIHQRPRLNALHLKTADDVNNARDKQSIYVAGLVTCRHRRELLNSQLLGVLGVIEKKDKMVHLVAGRLFGHSHLLGSLELPSRDFH